MLQDAVAVLLGLLAAAYAWRQWMPLSVRRAIAAPLRRLFGLPAAPEPPRAGGSGCDTGGSSCSGCGSGCTSPGDRSTTPDGGTASLRVQKIEFVSRR